MVLYENCLVFAVSLNLDAMNSISDMEKAVDKITKKGKK